MKWFQSLSLSLSLPLPLPPGKPSGYDRVRNAEIGNKVSGHQYKCPPQITLPSVNSFQEFELDVLEEAYTTEHWIVRIYKVKDLENRGV